jgi:hypothetical protein
MTDDTTVISMPGISRLPPLYIHFGGDDPVEATPEQRQALIDCLIANDPRMTQANALDTLYAMSSGERRRLLLGTHDRAYQHRVETDRVFRLAAEIDSNQARRNAEVADAQYDPVWGSPPATVAADNWGRSMSAPSSAPRGRWR